MNAHLLPPFRFLVKFKSDPVRSGSDFEGRPFPTQLHQIFVQQIVDCFVHYRHQGAPRVSRYFRICSQSASNFAWANSCVLPTLSNKRQDLRPSLLLKRPVHVPVGRAPPLARQRSEQYLTFSQSRTHRFRQANGRSQATQILLDRLSFLCTTVGSKPDLIKGRS